MLMILPESKTRAILLASRAIYSCIPFKAIQYYINTSSGAKMNLHAAIVISQCPRSIHQNKLPLKLIVVYYDIMNKLNMLNFECAKGTFF